MKEENIDLDEVRKFYKPYLKATNATFSNLPEPVQKVANELDGQKIPLSEAVAKIEAVTEGEVKVDSHRQRIVLTIGDSTFRVIKYRQLFKVFWILSRSFFIQKHLVVEVVWIDK